MQNQHTRELISLQKTSQIQQRPESPAVTLNRHAGKYKVHKLCVFTLSHFPWGGHTNCRDLFLHDKAIDLRHVRQTEKRSKLESGRQFANPPLIKCSTERCLLGQKQSANIRGNPLYQATKRHLYNR